MTLLTIHPVRVFQKDEFELETYQVEHHGRQHSHETHSEMGCDPCGQIRLLTFLAMLTRMECFKQ